MDNENKDARPVGYCHACGKPAASEDEAWEAGWETDTWGNPYCPDCATELEAWV